MPQMKNMMIRYRIFCNSLRRTHIPMALLPYPCLLYTSDAADE